MALIDLSHPLREEMAVAALDAHGIGGTHLDAPLHRFSGGQDLASLPLQAVAGLPGVSVNVSSLGERSIRLSLDQQDVRGRAVLVRTGRDEWWGTDRYGDSSPYLAEESVDLLLRGRAWLVGVDCPNVDENGDVSGPVHSRLLAEGILIVENLCNLERIPVEGFRFFAVPLPIISGASFPVRAFAELL